MDSIWTQTARLPQFDRLRSDRNTDVLIIGGGMAGVLCAYKLAQAGVDYVLVEADRIGGGITKNTTAKITSQHGLIYDKLIREFGVERSRLYLEANQTALEEYRALCQGLDCNFEEKDAFVYSVTNRKKIDRELTALDKLGFSAEFVKEIPLPFSTAGAVKFKRQAQFHPLKFIAAISKDLQIFEHTKVLELAPGKAVTNGGTVSADKIIVATHFPLLNKHGCYFLKMYQHRSYVLALNNAPDVCGMYLDENDKGLSFRTYCAPARPRCGPESAPGRRKPPDGQARGQLAGTGTLRQPSLPRRSSGGSLGHPGLHDIGRRALCRAVLQTHLRTLCGCRLQQVGHDFLHGGSKGLDRPGSGTENSLRGTVLPLSYDPPPPVGGKRAGVRPRTSDSYRPPLPPYGLRPEI